MLGFTQDERFLHSLAHNSFLRFWSWPNLFRDQGDSNKGGDGKEICDLVVVFDKDILLFSDKRISFSNDKPIEVAWSRWARKAIGESVKQVAGAKRWLQNYPERVFLDQKCTKRLPIPLPPSEQTKFHHIVVCHGMEGIIQTALNEPSFAFDCSIRGSDNWEAKRSKPFTLGILDEDDFIHVFNEATIGLALTEFDTIKDFLDYLEQRETLLTWSRTLKVQSESDIVQMYYESYDDENRKRNIAASHEMLAGVKNIDKGGIAKLYSNPSFSLKKEADKVGYFWDDLIENFSFHALNGSSVFKNWESPGEIEPGLRLLAKTSRFERRVLSEAFLAFYYKAQPMQRGTRLFMNPLDSSVGYLFFLLPDKPFNDHKVYRAHRHQMLMDYCAITKYLNDNLQIVVGIGAQTRNDNTELNRGFFNEGQDFVVYYASEWKEADYEYASELHDEYTQKGFIGNRSTLTGHTLEFPEHSDEPSIPATRITMKGSDRNKPCPCGSGIKAKKCCGR